MCAGLGPGESQPSQEGLHPKVTFKVVFLKQSGRNQEVDRQLVGVCSAHHWDG